MPLTSAFYSANEVNKPAANRVHHNNSSCGPSKEIHSSDRRSGTGGYRLCEVCDKINKDGK